MLTIGEILKKTRLTKKISFGEVEKATKIRQKYLIALEENEFDKLPPPTFTKGFIKNYSEFLGLNPKQLLLLYRREFNEKKETNLLPKGISNPLNVPIVRVAPNSVAVLLVISCISLFFLYLFSQYRTIALTPSLTVFTPKDKSIVRQETVDVTGKTDSDAKVSINDQNVPINLDGSFSQKVELQKGPNILIITAVNQRNRTAKITRSVTVQVP